MGEPANSFFASSELAESFTNTVLNLPSDSGMLGGLATFLGKGSDQGYHAHQTLPGTPRLASSRFLPVAFTSHVTTGNKSFVIDEEAGIMISTSRDLGILTFNIPPLPDTTAVYIDVPLQSAELHSIRLSTKAEAQQRCVIEISLNGKSQASVWINASPERAHRLHLRYTSRKLADDAYLTLKSMLNEGTSPTYINKSSFNERLNVSCRRMQHSASSRGESEMSADLRMHSEALFKRKDPNNDVDRAELQSESQSIEDSAEFVSESSAPGSTVLDMDSGGVLYGETASEITDQDRNEMRGIARSALHHHDQCPNSNGGSSSDEIQGDYAASNSLNCGEEQTESRLTRARRERPSRHEKQVPIESSQTASTDDFNHPRRSPRLQQKAPSAPPLLKKTAQSKLMGKETDKQLQMPASSPKATKAAPKNQNDVGAIARHAKQRVTFGTGDSDEMWNEGLKIEAEAGPIKSQHKHERSQQKKAPSKAKTIPLRPSEIDGAEAGQARVEKKAAKGSTGANNVGASTASTTNTNTENANIGKARTGKTRKGERCVGQTEREVASSPAAESAGAATLPARSKRAAATQAKRKIEDQASSEEALHDDLMSSSWEPEVEKKRVRKSAANKGSNAKRPSKVKNHHLRAKEHKAKVVPLPRSTVEHEPDWKLRDNAASDHPSEHNSPDILVEDSFQVIQATAPDKMSVPLGSEASRSQDDLQSVHREERQQYPLQTQKLAPLANTTLPSLKGTLQVQGRNIGPDQDANATIKSKEPSSPSSAIEETSLPDGQHKDGNRGPGRKHVQEEATQKHMKDPFNDRLRPLVRGSKHETDESPVMNASSKVKAIEPLNHQRTSKSHSDQQDQDNRLSKSAPYRGGSRPMPEQITNPTGKRKALIAEALPAKRKKAVTVERTSNTRARDVQTIQPTTPRTKSQRKAPLIHFGKSGPQNSGLVKVLNWKSDLPVAQGTRRTPLAATGGNLKSTLNRSTPILPCKETRETTSGSANLPPCEDSTPKRQPPRVGSQTMIADNGSPILVKDIKSARVQDENSPWEEQPAITPDGYLDRRFFAGDVQANEPVTPAKGIASPPRLSEGIKVNEQTHSQSATPNPPLSESKCRDLDKHAIESNGNFINLHTKRPVIPIEAHNPFGSGGPVRDTAFINRLHASNNSLGKPSDAHEQESERANGKAENKADLAHKLPFMPEDSNKTPVKSNRPLQRREHNKGRRKHSITPVAIVQLGKQGDATLGKQGDATHEGLPLWEDADKTLVEPEPCLHGREYTLRRRDDTDTSDSSDETSSSSSSSTSEDADLPKQSGGRAPHQQKIYSALMEVVKVWIFHAWPIRRLTINIANRQRPKVQGGSYYAGGPAFPSLRRGSCTQLHKLVSSRAEGQ